MYSRSLQNLRLGYPYPSPKQRCSPVNSNVFGAGQWQWLFATRGGCYRPIPTPEHLVSPFKSRNSHTQRWHFLCYSSPSPCAGTSLQTSHPCKKGMPWLQPVPSYWGSLWLGKAVDGACRSLFEGQRQGRVFLVSGPLNADCVHVALEVFLCPSRLPVEVVC